MKSIIIFIFLVTCNLSFADCYQKLTKDYSSDSTFYKLNSYYINSNPNEYLDEQMAANGINRIFKNNHCEHTVVAKDVKCEKVLRTTLCRLDHKIGYFLILKDYVDGVNIIFNRWD